MLEAVTGKGAVFDGEGAEVGRDAISRGRALQGRQVPDLLAGRKEVIMARIFALAYIALFPILTSASERLPWQLPTDERLARRFERLSGPGVAHAIVGSDTPELFLPGELMALFLTNVMAADQTAAARARESYRHSLAIFTWDAGKFWRDVDDAAAEYHRLTSVITGEAGTADLSRRVCASRVAALTELRRRYSRFDEFLYRTVAPRSGLTIDRSLSREWLSWLEGGCK